MGRTETKRNRDTKGTERESKDKERGDTDTEGTERQRNREGTTIDRKDDKGQRQGSKR